MDTAEVYFLHKECHAVLISQHCMESEAPNLVEEMFQALRRVLFVLLPCQLLTQRGVVDHMLEDFLFTHIQPVNG